MWDSSRVGGNFITRDSARMGQKKGQQVQIL